jgi:outer membrane protein insertion porin family/translocation and assembly module TamA
MWRTSTAAVLALSLFSITTAAAQGRNRIEVTRLTIEGVRSVPIGDLRAAIATGESSWIPWGAKRYFNRAQFEADLRRIQVFYADRGFPDAKVQSFDLDLNEQQDEIAIKLVIDEGQPVVVDEVRFEGFEVLRPRRLNWLKRNAPLKARVPRDRAALQMTRERALDFLRDSGYPYAAVRIGETEGSAARHVIVTYRATTGPLAQFGSIDVIGNSSVTDDVVVRHLTFRPGQRFRLSQMQESQRRLYGLELFQFVNVERVDTPEDARAQSAASDARQPSAPSQPESVPIKVTVTEGKHRKLNLGVGYGTEEKARTDVNWRHVNFFGGARTAGIEGRWSSLDRGVRLNFEQPYVFSPRVSLAMSGESWHTAEPAFTLNTSGGRVTLLRRFATGPIGASRFVSTLSVGLIHNRESYSIANELLSDLSRRDELIALKLDPRTGAGSGVLSAIAFDYSRNTTGNLLNARRGYLASVHVEEAGKILQGDYDYREVTLEGRHYLPLFRRLVWANKLRIGGIAGSGDQQNIVPFFKRYFLGGSSSLRGWGRFQVAPLSGSGLPLGGYSMLEASSELRVPIWRGLSLVLFGDAGNVWAQEWSIRPGDLRYDVGPGLRYQTPIGPIRFDVGYQINPIEGLLVQGKPQTRRYRMHFSIGQAF